MSSKFVIWFVAGLCVLFGIAEMCFHSQVVQQGMQWLLGPAVFLAAAWATNQGVYNLFLAAGLIWAARCQDATLRLQLSRFFLGCVAIAGLYGAVTVSWVLAAIQTAPAAIALYLAYRARSQTVSGPTGLP